MSQTQKSRSRRWIAALGSLAIVFLAGATAWSGVLPGMWGHAWASPSCFLSISFSSGAAHNTCTGGDSGLTNQRKWVLPIETTNNANHNFRERIRGNGTVATLCRAYIVSSTNFGMGGNSVSTTSTTFTLTDPGSVFLPVDATAHLVCDVAERPAAGQTFDGGGVLSMGD